MEIHVWNEVSDDWRVFELDLPMTTKDPEAINDALAMAVEDHDKVWKVEASGIIGPVLTITTRDPQGRLSIIVVNYNQTHYRSE